MGVGEYAPLALPPSSGSPGIDVDVIENLMNLPRLTFMDEKCGNLKVVVDCGEVTKNINREKKSDVLQAYRCSLCGKCYRRDWGKHDFPCGCFFCG